MAPTVASITCVWLHGDSLSPHDAALQAYPDAPVVFVFDEPLLTGHYRLTFKRLFFMYECLVDLYEQIPNPVKELRRGRVVDEVLDVCRACGATQLAVTETYAPRYRQFVRQFEQHGLTVRQFPKPKLVPYSGPAPKRFMAFWKRIERAAFRD
ncbi:deoxyribodipyrimidine photo-lyase [Chloracidobacterium validum]|uniref:Deoxyribodipyrimidine photo-lyase n=1 Tax=Chloracidobacterium validum TaxID=2821543 RepID=A0ABX8BAM7_9BACT|nr:deoxyribodipyrimidine photo-lyase [Chloracidobacterium validum]QUW02785.1 deoxyribodipyrimidine photo-lyase [Chloracidobacterium validum]